MSRLAILLLLAIPALALAEPIEITGTDTLTLMWRASDGPVVGYETRVAYLDGTEGEHTMVPENERTIQPRKGVPWRLQVKACQLADTDLIVCDGPWSQPSDSWVLCPLRSDINCDLKVRMDDFIILSNDFTKTVDEEPDDDAKEGEG